MDEQELMRSEFLKFVRYGAPDLEHAPRFSLWKWFRNLWRKEPQGGFLVDPDVAESVLAALKSYPCFDLEKTK